MMYKCIATALVGLVAVQQQGCGAGKLSETCGSDHTAAWKTDNADGTWGATEMAACIKVCYTDLLVDVEVADYDAKDVAAGLVINTDCTAGPAAEDAA